jgi:chromosome segregation protein
MRHRCYHAPPYTAPEANRTAVRLSKLKLAGFKTFVDPTTVLTPGNLVGVVGPNGCGKSNIIDAVRWVLGESRASALRGESMQDVIFNGSVTRKPVSRASVELVFDNNEGKAAGQWSRYAEISVKRVLDRSGESSYLINNVQVRRKDVIDLFLGTGLGPRAYAIIEQGMISRIIEARPEEIRGFLEEAAGVTKYRERRKETEGRLRDARDNLVRIDDIRTELGERIERLREQAAVAARFRELNAAHIQRQQLLWLLKRNEARTEHGRLHDEVNLLSTRLESDSARLQTLESAVEEARKAHFAATEATHHAQSDLFAASAEVSRLESELKHLQDTRQRLQSRLTELEREHGHWDARQSALTVDQQRWSGLLEHAGMRVEQAQARHDEAAQRLPELETARRGADATVAATRRELAQTEQLLRVAEANHASAARALDQLSQRRARLEADSIGISGPDPLALAQCESRVSGLQEALEDRQGQLGDAQSRFSEAQVALKAALADERRMQQESSALRARYDALAQLQAGVQSRGQLGEWLKRHGLSDLAPLWRGIRVEPGWERAVAAALREHLSALTGDVGNAVGAVLKQAPPDTVSLALPALAEMDAAGAIMPPSGAAPLADRITVLDPALTAIVAECVRGCFTVEALEPWMDRRAELASGCRVVDANGTLMSRHALSHYAPDNRTDGVMERQREIEALSAQRAELEEQVARAHATLQNAETHAGALQEQIGSLRREVQDTQQQLHGEQVELLKLTQAHQRAIEKREQIHHDLNDLVHLESTEREHQLRADMERERNAELAGLQREQVDAAQQVLDERSHELQEVRVLEQTTARELQEARFSERECTGKLEEAARNLQLAAEQLQRIVAETRTREQELDASDSSRSQAALQEALLQRERREAVLHACRDTQEQAAARLKQTEELRLRTEQEAAPLRERIGELRLALQAADLAVTQFTERLVEVDADEAALAPLLTESLRETALQRDVARLARELAELGQVNLAALDELQGAEQRLGYLNDQCADLTQAIDTLEDAIRRIDRETREQLQDTYNTVSQHLNTLFPLLFGGGQARLVLTGDEILDAGIQIVAQPPGKKNTSIHLLSGGEKALTAIALVFAMFQLNPAPFCMLDEVDAPLDDANTERYCQMVKRMSAHTQFIFISHSKVTMEIARQLIGVTMQEQGVSRVVEVDIEEALRMAETAAA